MKKILLCSSTLHISGRGVPSYAHDLIRVFKNEYEFAAVTGDNYNDITVIKHIYQVDRNDFSIANAKKLLDIISKEQPDIILNSCHYLMTLVTPFINNRIKIISVSHFVNGKLSWAAGINSLWADKLISLSTYGKVYLDNFFSIKDSEKTQVIFNFISNLKDVDVNKKKSRNTLKIVYPGGCSYQKSAEIVCSMLKRLQKTDISFEFYWLGKTKAPGANWPISFVHDIKDCINMKDPRIKHIGLVDREKAQKIMSDCNIFLLPSRGEGFPISLLEAMRGSCIPIISDAKHGSLDIIKNGTNGIVVKQGSVNSLYNAVIDIIRNHKTYAPIYDNCLHNFNDELKENIWHKKMSDLLNSVPSHSKRTQFSDDEYMKGVRQLKSLFRKSWIKDRFIHQPYHIIYFHLLKFFR